MEIRTFSDHNSFLAEAGELLAEHLALVCHTAHGVVLAGGNTPLPVYRAVAAKPPVVDKSLRILFSDERMAPDDSAESNYANMRPMLEALGLPAEHVLKVATDHPLEEAVEKYDNALREFVRVGGVITLAVLGLGADGHTASLFSVDAARAGGDDCAVAVPREIGPDRVSMTSRFLCRAERIVFWVAGEDKADVVARLQREPDALPAGVAVQDAGNVELWYSPNT